MGASADSCVERARALAERHAVKILSLDVFDTLLWRVVPEPTDAFVLVARSLRDAGHLRAPTEAFARLREAAEARARASSLRERSTPEVSLEQIYEELPPGVVADAEPDDLAAVEVEVERSITFPDVAVIELARSLQDSRGVRVVLVSDTYLSAAQVRHLLDREPFTRAPVDAVFTSSDHGCNKGSGLHRLVLAALGVDGGDVLHLGDHPDADQACAAKEGIHSVLLTRRPEPLPTLLEREGMTRGDAVRRPRAPLADGARDFGLTALRAKALRRAEGAALSDSERAFWAAGAAVFGPVLTGFAEWVHDRATAMGASRVFCVMREGAFLAPLLEAARRQRQSGVEASTLWLSRYVCSQAAIVTASAEEIEAFLDRRRAPTLAVACEGLGLTAAELPGLQGQAGERLDDLALRRRFLQAVTGRDELRAAVLGHCSRVRRRLAEHVVRTVGRDAGQAVLVDLGWGGSIQAALDVALRAENIDLETRGLYLITNEAAVERMLDGMAAEGFLGNVGLPEPAVRWLMRSPEVLEQVCMPEVGSLLGFDDEGNPVTTAVTTHPGQRMQRQAVQDGVTAFQQEWGRYRHFVPAEHLALGSLARSLLRIILLRFVVDPTSDEASLFGSWLHDENRGSEASETVLSGFAPENLEYMTPLQLLELPMTRLYWPFGLAAVHNPPLARAAAAVAFGELPAEIFVGPDTHATLYVDYGAGLMPWQQPVVRSNSRGLYYLREQVSAHPLRAVGIGFPPGPGLVRLDWMRMRFGLRGRSEPAIVEIRWPDGDPRVRYHDAELLSDNLLLGRRRPARLSYDCPAQWGLDAYSVEVELGFGWLASAPGIPARRDRAAVALALARRAYPRARKVLQLVRALAARLRHS